MNFPTRRACFALAVAARLFLAAGQVCAGQGITEDQVRRDTRLRELICGPQCVNKVLEHYDRPADLVTLVYELQWPDVEKGTSLAALGQALEKRGIYVRAVSVSNDNPIRWPYPVVVHLQEKQGRHFAVLFPGDGEHETLLWSTGAGPISFPARNSLNSRTPIVLLTAPHRITDADLGGLASRPVVPIVVAAALPLVPSLVLLLLLRRVRSARLQSQAKE